MEASGHVYAQLLQPQGKSPWHPPDKRPGGPQSQSGHDGN